MEFELRNREMAQKIIEQLVARGELTSRQDALKKFHDPEWIARFSYGHVAHILQGPAGIDACRSVFAEQESEGPTECRS